MFTWKPIYSELATALPAWRTRQAELIAILHAAAKQGLKVSKLEDEDKKGNKVPLQVIDPFTFFAFFNRAKIRLPDRITLITIIKDNLGLTSTLPSDFEGVPVMNPQRAWFFSYQKDREPEAIDTLWDFSKSIVERSPESVSPDLFARALKIRQVGLGNLTMGLFWMRPDDYLALDKRNCALLKTRGIVPNVTDWPSYLALLHQVKHEFPGLPWSDLSLRAYQAKSTGPRYWLFQGNPGEYDIVGALRAGVVRTWRVSAHKKDIQPGDGVVIWQSGKDAGAYALATTVGPVSKLAETAAEKRYYLEPQKGKRRFIGVELKINRVLCDRPISKQAAMKDNVLRHAPLGVQGTNFALSEEQFQAFTSLASATNGQPANMLPALNIILYGPPGTGKTYRLRNHYMEMFTERQAVLTTEERAAALVKDLAWWEVISLALLDTPEYKGSVAQILTHPLIQARLKLSANKNPRAMLWASLQSHTKADCPNVRYATRIDPLLFFKDETSVWSVDPQFVDSEVPGLQETLREFRRPAKTVAPTISRFRFTTFHQSFSYEDFIEGIKPQLDERTEGRLDYEVRDGVFKEICREAAANPGKDYALFIDEINRGNVASIFGELITLVEEDKRLGKPNELKTTLPYSRDEFCVPSNVYIIGTMNTADRSVEALDTALRRRFTFEEMRPDADKINQPPNLRVDLRKLFETINARIERLLDHDHCVGHYYLMEIKDFATLQSVFANKIIPLLREYFYGSPAKVGMVLGEAFVSRKTEKSTFARGSWGADEMDEKEVFTFTDVAELTEQDFQAIYAENRPGV